MLHAHDISKQTYIKNHKYTKSQSRLEVPTSIKFQANSPKLFNTEVKTDRSKGQENIEVSPFELGQTIKATQDYALKILTPSNRNVRNG